MSGGEVSWGDAIVEGSLEWAFLTRDDLGEVADLCAAIEYFDDPTQTRSLADLIVDFNLPSSHATSHAVVGRDRGGTIVAYAWNHISPSDDPAPKVWIEFGVHPAWRHHRIGLRLVGWCIDRARTWYRHIQESHPEVGDLWIGCAVDEHLRVAEDVRTDGQLHPMRWFFDAHRPLNDPPIPHFTLPSGIRLQLFDSSWSEATREAHNLAFSTRAGSHDVSREDWDHSLSREDFRPQWSWLAVDTRGRVVGYALNSEVYDAGSHWSQGWTERIGVHPELRSQGIGRCLLAASLRSFATAGCNLAGIGIDTDAPERATILFQGLDYILDDRMVLFAATFRN